MTAPAGERDGRMAQRVIFIHTVSGLVDLFKGLCAEITPQADLCHISDESLIQAVLAAGGLTPAIYRRVCEHVIAAEQAGADVIQLTCSSVSPCVDVAGFLVSVPVLKIDEPMVEHAVDGFASIGVIATAPTTLRPTTELVQDRARIRGRSVEVESVLCEGAYDAFFAGDLDRHDRIVRDRLSDLMTMVDVVLLAQVSMARVADTLSESEKPVPVLTSPRFAVERLAQVLGGSA